MIKIGDTVYVVGNDVRRGDLSPSERIVTKVGKKWFTANIPGHSRGTQYSLRTGWENAGDCSATARAWVSLERYQEHVALKTAWARLRKAIGSYGNAPESLMHEELNALAEKIEAANALMADDK